MKFKELKTWYKKSGIGFFFPKQLQATRPDVLEAFERELSQNTGRVGCYVCHIHHKETNDSEIKFKGMEIGYYVRSKNPFSWKFRKTYGNH